MSGHCKYISHFSINPFLFCFRALRWRLGLQAMQGLTILSFFLGLFFRSASMYHPQRDAISHIKHQKEKVKGINSKDKLKEKKNKPQFFSVLKKRNIRIFLLSSSISSNGIFTPFFYIVSNFLSHIMRIIKCLFCRYSILALFMLTLWLKSRMLKFVEVTVFLFSALPHVPGE